MFARKQPSDDKQRFDLQHRRGVNPPAALPTEPPPQASKSTNSVCLTRSMNYADINCPEQSRHIRSRTSPLLQQSAHHVKWLLPLAHQKMTKEAVIVSCCVTNRQNTWLGSVNILLSISDLLQNVLKIYLWNYKSCKGEISPNCAY